MFAFLLLQLFSQYLNNTNSFSIDNFFFESYQAEYKEINDGVVLNSAKPWGEFNQRFEIPIGFNYQFFDTSFTNLKLETSGRIVFDDKHHYFVDGFSAIGLQDKGFNKKRSESPISYKDTTIKGVNTLIIQFRNAGLKKDTQAILNFQIWLYDKHSKIELHMGESYISNFENSFSYGPYFSIYHLKSISPLYVKQRFGSTGKNARQIYHQSGENINLLNNSLKKLPSKGTVYCMSL